MRDNESADGPRRRLWFNWPLALGLLINFVVWIAVFFWFFVRRR